MFLAITHQHDESCKVAAICALIVFGWAAVGFVSSIILRLIRGKKVLSIGDLFDCGEDSPIGPIMIFFIIDEIIEKYKDKTVIKIPQKQTQQSTVLGEDTLSKRLAKQRQKRIKRKGEFEIEHVIEDLKELIK